jgi:hypothetical protein
MRRGGALSDGGGVDQEQKEQEQDAALITAAHVTTPALSAPPLLNQEGSLFLPGSPPQMRRGGALSDRGGVEQEAQ